MNANKKPNDGLNIEGQNTNGSLQNHFGKVTNKLPYFQCKVDGDIVIDLKGARHFYKLPRISHAVYSNGVLTYTLSGKPKRAVEELGRILFTALCDYLGKEFNCE